MFFDDYPMVNLASRGSRNPFGVPSYGSRNPYNNPYGYAPRQQYHHPYVSTSGYDDSHYERERQRRALLQARRQQQMEEEQERYNAEISRRREVARQQQVEANRQRAIRAFRLRMLSKFCTKIQRWWRGILQQRRAKEEKARREREIQRSKELQEKQAAAAFVVTRAMKRFCAVKQARKIAQSLRRLQQLTLDMNVIAPRGVPPPTDTKQRLLVEDTLEKIILKVDLVDTYGSLLVRANRKRLVVDANERLRRLDESGPTMLNSPMLTRKASEPPRETDEGEPAVMPEHDIDMTSSECDGENDGANIGHGLSDDQKDTDMTDTEPAMGCEQSIDGLPDNEPDADMDDVEIAVDAGDIEMDRNRLDSARSEDDTEQVFVESEKVKGDTDAEFVDAMEDEPLGDGIPMEDDQTDVTPSDGTHTGCMNDDTDDSVPVNIL
eukprot:m.1639585 g.1639585  ORF g.1639585 m.1639585 type:complete len:437 (-) comp36704_c0_seq1:152-1462(-)